MTSLPLNAINTDGGTQPRAVLDAERVAQYAVAYRAGEPLPPVRVVHDGDTYWLYDGYHRCAAAEDAGLDSVPAEVTQGTLADAQWLSYAANREHDASGLYRSNADKRRAVEAALRHEKGATMSSAAIAEHVGVHRSTVDEYRKQVADSAPSPRTGRDGKQYPASNANKGRQYGDERAPVNPRIAAEIDRIEAAAGKRIMSKAEYEAEAGTAKPHSRGVHLANEAINILMRIPPDDPDRANGLAMVVAWVKANK